MRSIARKLGTTAIGLAIAAQIGCGADTTVAASAGLDAPDRPFDVAFDSLYTVGAIDGEAWETFGAISQVAFDGAGQLYVFDRQNARITVVGLDGQLVREIGKKGGGPGEFNSPTRIAVSADGRIAVADFGVPGVSLFDAQGQFTESVRIDPSQGFPTNTLFLHPTENALVTTGGGIVMRAGGGGQTGRAGGGGQTGRTGGGPPAERAEPTSVPIRKIALPSGEETVVHDAWLAPRPEREGSRVEGSSGSGGRMVIQMSAPTAFQPRVHLGVLPDGRYLVVDSTTYTIDVIGADGTIQQSLSRPIQPTVVTDEIKEKEKARRLAEFEERQSSGSSVTIAIGGVGGRAGGGMSDDMAKQLLDAQRSQLETMLFADAIPVIAGLGVEWNGRLWVERAPAEPGEEGPIDLIDVDGNYYGTIQPNGPRIPAAFGPNGLVAYIETDEYDVPSVRVMRLREDGS